MLFKEKCKELKINWKKATKEQTEEIMRTIDHKVMQRTMLRYQIMRIRSKVSYHAFQARESIVEKILKQIVKTYSYFYGEPESSLGKKGAHGFVKSLENMSVVQNTQMLTNVDSFFNNN